MLNIAKNSIDGEAVEQTRAAGAYQIVLAAALRGMRGIPGCVSASDAVGMSNLSRALPAAGPVIARVILTVRIGSPVRLRAGQHIVSVG